jgi:hypothetical protein
MEGAARWSRGWVAWEAGLDTAGEDVPDDG